MTSSAKRTALALVWLALLAIAGWAISQRLELSGDLRKFMPSLDTNWRAETSEAASAAVEPRATVGAQKC